MFHLQDNQQIPRWSLSPLPLLWWKSEIVLRSGLLNEVQAANFILFVSSLFYGRGCCNHAADAQQVKREDGANRPCSSISHTNLYHNDLHALVLWRCPMISALMFFFFQLTLHRAWTLTNSSNESFFRKFGNDAPETRVNILQWPSELLEARRPFELGTATSEQQKQPLTLVYHKRGIYWWWR